MSWINFSHLIAGNDANIEHWHNAIKANPNTPEDALKVAILNRVIDMKDMELLENLCSCVVSIVNQAVEHRLQSDGACAHEWDGGYPNDDNVYCIYCGMVRPAAKA